MTNIVITPANPVIAPGSNLTFMVTGYFSDRSKTNLTSANGLVWSSSVPTVASIDTNGLATSLSAGATTISAIYSNLTDDTVLTVLPLPVISTNPVSTTVSPGGSVTLSVSASGSDLSYQWAFDGTNIMGATNATLVITNVSPVSAGSYTVTVSNPAGSVVSQAASVASMNIEMFRSVVTNWNTLANWTRTSAPYPNNWRSIASSSDGTHLAAVINQMGGAISNQGIYTSANAGVTWTQTSAPGEFWNSIASSSDGTQLAAVVFTGGIFTSTNAGVTWTQTGAPSEYWTSIASSSDGTKLAACYNNNPGGGIYTSTNAGVTWTQTSAPGKNWSCLAASSDGTKLAALAALEGIWTSTNGGLTWTQSGPGYGYWYSIASSSDGTKLAAVFNPGGIYTSTNAGATWTQTSAPFEDWYCVASSSDGTHLAAGAYPSGIYISSNAGATWTQTAPVGEWTSIASSSDGTHLVAVNGREIWTAQAGVTNTELFPFAGVVVDGPPGTNYLIQASSDLPGNWTSLTNVALPSGPYLYIDYSSTTNAQQFYRAVPAP